MSWVSEYSYSWIEKFFIRVLQNGPIPRHLAIIMDGNRRYARKQGVERQKGHFLGFEKLSETLRWCLDMGVKEVSLYTFSIENFKRSDDEINGLMDLFREKLQELLHEKEKMKKYEVCIRMIGDLQLLPCDIQKLVAEVVLETKQYNKIFLNVCICYTSRDEITDAVCEIAGGYSDGKLQLSDITEYLLSKSMYAAGMTPPDLLVRTSGEVRLSDFLCWQSSYSLLSFLDILWPEFTIWHLFFTILYYQHHVRSMEHTCDLRRNALGHIAEDQAVRDRQANFLNSLCDKRMHQLFLMKEGLSEQKHIDV